MAELYEVTYNKPKPPKKAKSNPANSPHDALRLQDFYAYMPSHSYIFAPSREIWPAGSVNSRISPIQVGVDKETGDPIKIKASTWLDQNQPVEQMTWVPGEPMLIEDRLIAEGAWIVRPGCRVFNLYREPSCEAGNASRATPWLDHLRNIYPDDHEHIIAWLAHRVQRPAEKINHALLLGGAPGIGKDTLLYPVSYAIGYWNFEEVTPIQLLGRFNGFVKSVILRVNEARDLGEINRYSFYEHCKPLIAAPPDFVRCDEKGIREYRVPNVTGVVITSNYKTDGCYLPAEDRRHYVAWSHLSEADFTAGYFDGLYRWYEAEGRRNVATYLATYDLSAFDPKAPPPKTPAFWEIVDANTGSEESDLADVIDKMTPRNEQPPIVLTLSDISNLAPPELGAWLRDTKNRRQVPKRLEKVGYVRVINEYANDHLWKIDGRRQAVYGRAEKPLVERINAARKLLGSDQGSR